MGAQTSSSEHHGYRYASIQWKMMSIPEYFQISKIFNQVDKSPTHVNFSLSFQFSLIAKTQARDYDTDINRASLYIIWKGFHWCTSVSSSGTLSSCVYMISNIWMKTAKKSSIWIGNKTEVQISVHWPLEYWTQRRSPHPKNEIMVHKKGSWNDQGGKGASVGRQTLKRELHYANRRWEGIKPNTVKNMKNTNLKESNCGNQELWSLKAIILAQLKTQLNPSYQGKGHPRNSSF